MPYLGEHFEFTEKKKGKTSFLKHIFVVNGGNMASAGINAGLGITGMKYSLDAVIYSVTRSLFLEQQDDYLESLRSYDEELFEADW